MRSLLLVVAFSEELKVVNRLLKKRKEIPDKSYRRLKGVIEGFPVEVLMTCMGMKAARKASEEVINNREHGGVLILGYCGGLSIILKTGDTILASKVLNNELKNPISLDASLCEKLGRAHVAEGLSYRCGPLATQSKVIETVKEKRAIHAKSHAEAVDMESYEVIEVARQKDLRSAVAKVVVDDADTELPNFNDYFEKKGKIDHLNIAPVFVAQPVLTMQLSKSIKAANLILQKSIPKMVKVLGEQWNIEKVEA